MIAPFKTRRWRVGAALATAGAAALLMALEAAPANSPPPPAAGEPSVGLPSKVLDAASVYVAYVDRASGVNPAFSDGDAIAGALRSTEAYESTQMQRGEIAYAAVVALQDPTFVASMRKFGVDPAQRDQVAAAILADPRYATVFPGADSAAGLVIAALNDQGQRVLATGQHVKQAAYDIQHQAWSKGAVPDHEARLALAKSLSQQALTPETDTESRLQLASTGATPLLVSGAANAGPYSPTVTQALAVAALAALGEGGEAYGDRMLALLDQPEAYDCLHSAKLSLYECLAVAKPHYEDVFCMGQHVLSDTGQCIIKSTIPRLAAPPPVLVAVADTKPAPVKKKAVVHKKRRPVKHKAG